MSDLFDDDGDSGAEDNDAVNECDCEDAEVDILTGRAHCYSCGRVWWLDGEQIKREAELQTQLMVDQCEQGDGS